MTAARWDRVLWGLAVWGFGLMAASWIQPHIFPAVDVDPLLWRVLFVFGFGGYVHGLSEARREKEAKP